MVQVINTQARLDEALDALQMLVDKVDSGRVRSAETYNLHVKVLQKNGRYINKKSPEWMKQEISRLSHEYAERAGYSPDETWAELQSAFFVAIELEMDKRLGLRASNGMLNYAHVNGYLPDLLQTATELFGN